LKKSYKDIKNEIISAVSNLKEIVMLNCNNNLSDNYSYFLLEINAINENKEFVYKSLNEIVLELSNIYYHIYDLNFYVYKSTKKNTIIQINYFLKSSLDEKLYDNINDFEPMIHSKVDIPPYRKDEFQKFDINWKLGGLKHLWKMFWYKLKFEIKYRKRIKT
jgi:hypothetical protein